MTARHDNQAVRWTFLVLTLPVLAQLFLPLAYSMHAWRVVEHGIDTLSYDPVEGVMGVGLGLPFGLVLPIIVLQVRLLFGRPLSGLAAAAAYLLGDLSIVATAASFGYVFVGELFVYSHSEFGAGACMVIGVLAIWVILLNLRKARQTAESALCVLLCGYVFHAACFVATIVMDDYKDLNTASYLSMYAVLLLTVQIVYYTKRNIRLAACRQQPDASTGA